MGFNFKNPSVNENIKCKADVFTTKKVKKYSMERKKPSFLMFKSVHIPFTYNIHVKKSSKIC